MLPVSSRTVRRAIVSALLLSSVLSIPLPLSAMPRGSFSAADEEIIQKKWPGAIEAPSGLRYIVTKEGTGPRAMDRQRLSVLYKGSLIDGTVFSEKLDPKDPFVFALGSGDVIQGWDIAFADMRKGEKRTLIIPYALGLGLRGRDPDIPNRATLIFEVELLNIE